MSLYVLDTDILTLFQAGNADVITVENWAQ